MSQTTTCLQPETGDDGPASVQGGRANVWPLVALWIVAADTLGLYTYLSHRLYLLNPVWIYLTIYGILFGFYAYASGRLVPRIAPAYGRHALAVIVIGAIVFRLVALSTEPSLSTDMYRYVWDGRLTMHGINPYRWSPNAQTLRWLRDGVWEQMDYKAYQTIYMPVSQIVFALCNFLFKNSLIGYKLVFTLFDIGVIGLLLRILKTLGRNPMQVVWYAWCPLPITEVSIAGHQDVVGVFFLLLSFVLVLRRRRVWLAGIALVCAVLTKGFALMLMPMMVRNYGKRFALPAAISLVYLAMPLIVYLPQFLHGMTQYLDNVHVNSSLFNWTNMALAHITYQHYEIANKLTDAATLGVAAWAAWRPASSYADLLRRAFIVLAVIMMVIPTLFPWYLVWVLPFLPLIGKRPSWAFVALVCTIGLLYTYYISIKPLWWTPILEYVPFYLILVWEYAGWRLGREPIGLIHEKWSARASRGLRKPSAAAPE